MKVIRLTIVIAFFFLLNVLPGCTRTTHVSQETPPEKDTVFLFKNNILDPIGLVDVFLKEIRLMGYEARDLSTTPAQDNDDENDQGYYGSGFFISEDGLFVTAYHVVEQAETIILRKINGDSIRAEVLIEDPINDIAILSAIGAQKEDYWLSLENSHDASIGDEIMVLGYPVPDKVGPKPKLAAGYVSSDVGIKGNPTRFEITAPLEPGCSGAAILNIYNEVVGIASEQTNAEWFLMSRTGPLPPDINFGIKIEHAKILLEACLDEIPRKASSLTSLEDAIHSTALVLINMQDVPVDFQLIKWDRIVLVEFSRVYFCYVVHYTIFEFNRKWTDMAAGEISTSGYIGGAPISNPGEIVEAFIREMRLKKIL